MTGRAFVFAVACLLWACGPAAAGTIAPPGNSGISQYLETVPTGGGRGVPSAGSGSTGGGPPSAGRTLRTLAKLSRLGRAGRAAASLGRDGLPSPSARSSTGSRGRPHLLAPMSRVSAATGPPTSTGDVEAIVHALAGSGGGLGVLLPLTLAGCIVGVGALGIARRRRD